MTDIQAAVGIEQMKRLDWIVERRRQLAHRYTAALTNHPWLRSPHVPEYASARSVLLPLYPQMTSEEQGQVIAALNAEATGSFNRKPEACAPEMPAPPEARASGDGSNDPKACAGATADLCGSRPTGCSGLQ